MKIGSKEFDFVNECYIMGILNVTPDSFSDGGKFIHPDAALRQTERMLSEGMDILDIGGESTRPGYIQIPEAEEIERTAPVIDAIRKRFDVPISVDTYKWRVAEAGIAAGADMVNDIWGLQYDAGEMAFLLAKTGLPCCLMHNRKTPVYDNFIGDMLTDLQRSITIAEQAGIAAGNMLLDPGIGFAKTYEQNLEALRHLGDIRQRLGCPVLLGTSRKSVIGLTLDLPADDRLEGTLATTVIGVIQGVSVVRVHDVKENARAVRMALAIRKGSTWTSFA